MIRSRAHAFREDGGGGVREIGDDNFRVYCRIGTGQDQRLSDF